MERWMVDGIPSIDIGLSIKKQFDTLMMAME